MLALFTIAIYTSWTLILLILMVISVLYLLGLLPYTWAKVTFMLTVLVFSTSFLPATPYWPAFMNNKLWKLWRDYFNYSYVFMEHLQYDDRYLFVHAPHGVFPIGQLLCATFTPTYLPYRRVYGMAANAVLKVPLFKHLLTYLGIVSADKANFQRYLRQHSVAVLPGGIAEMYRQYDDREVMVLRSRKGFVRLAVEEGVQIVPVYFFGNSQLLKFGPRFLERWGRKYQAALGYCFNHWGPFPIVRQVKLMMAVGLPIPVPQTSPTDPSFEKVVDEVHAQVIEGYELLYNTYKGVYGWKDRPLVIE